MAQKGDLLSVRQDIRVVDATIRDGGLCNNFRFDDKFIKDLYQANVKAGVDYMEFGYKASKEIFNEDDFGKWKFCNDSDIRKIVGDNKTGLKIAVMADVGRTEIERVEQKIQGKVFYIKNLQVDIEILASAEKDTKTKEQLEQLAEKIRFSDPMSNEQLAVLEDKISLAVENLKSSDDKMKIIEDLNLLLDERNRKCKILK